MGRAYSIRPYSMGTFKRYYTNPIPVLGLNTKYSLLNTLFQILINPVHYRTNNRPITDNYNT